MPLCPEPSYKDSNTLICVWCYLKFCPSGEVRTQPHVKHSVMIMDLCFGLLFDFKFLSFLVSFFLGNLCLNVCIMLMIDVSNFWNWRKQTRQNQAGQNMVYPT